MVKDQGKALREILLYLHVEWYIAFQMEIVWNGEA